MSSRPDPNPNPEPALPPRPREDPDPDHPFDVKGFWHWRGYLPHFESAEVIQSITYRLHDSLPSEVVAALLDAEGRVSSNDPEVRRKIERYLDAGHGACWLRDPSVAESVVRTFRFRDGQAYRLHAWVVMPNHVHLLAQLIAPHTLSAEVKAWKAVTAREVNHRFGRTGSVWQRDYWERYIRDENHYRSVVEYIHQNPVKAGLAKQANDWPWSSSAEWEERRQLGGVGGPPS